MPQSERSILKHFLAGLAYRMQKALRQAPPDFATFKAQSGVRSPDQIIRHMNTVLCAALSRFEDVEPASEQCPTFEDEIDRFHGLLEALGEHLDQGTPFATTDPERLLQGAFSDVMTHVGQLAMLRRLAGSPIPPEKFHDASISSDNLSMDQPIRVNPDREWRDAEGRPQASKGDS